MATTTSDPATRFGALAANGLIDLDTHVGLPFEDPVNWVPRLQPFLSSACKRRLEEGSVSFIGGAWNNARHFVEPGGANRIDNPGSEERGRDPAFVIDDHVAPNGIVANVIITHGGPAYLVQSEDICAELTSAFNDYHCAHWVDFDPRFRLSISVPYRDPHAAVVEIERLADRPGVVSVYLQPTSLSFAASHYDRILAAANAAELTVFTHPGSDHLYGDAYLAGSFPDSAFDRYMGWNDVGAANVANLVLSGVFERYPRLKFVFAEFGWAWLSPLIRRLDHMWATAPAMFPMLRMEPSRYIPGHVWVTSQPAMDVPRVKHENLLLDQIQAERTMCFSSDYPHWDADDSEQIFRGADQTLMARILHDNALDAVGPRLGVT
jgi:predicted TIM-barrel fold metal-dependent hydrolase